MPSYRTEAVVIKTNDYGEADRILTLYTRQRGKIRAIAKGVKRLESRKAGSIDLLSYASLFLAEGRNLDIILEAQLLNPFVHLKMNLTSIAAGFKIAELVDQFTPDHNENHSIFHLLVKTLEIANTLTDKEDVGNIFRSFELKYLAALGFQPQFGKCVHCNNLLTPTNNRFSALLGGIICGACSTYDASSRPVTNEAIKIIRFLQDEDLEQSVRLKYPKVLGIEVEQHIRYYLEYLLEKELKTTGFVERIKGMKNG